MNDWGCTPISQVARIAIGGTPSRTVPSFWSDAENGKPWASIADLRTVNVGHTNEYISALGAASSNVKLVAKGTPIMSFKLTIGRTSIAGRDLYTNEAIAAFYADETRLDPRFLFHVLPSAAGSVITDVAVKGATLNKKSLATIPLNLPPLPEQRRIAEILDTLDDEIRGTEQIVAKLRLVKQGALVDFMTRGVSHHGTVRPRYENAPHLYLTDRTGPRPKEWTPGLLDNFATRGSGHTPNKNVPSFWNGGIKWVSLADSSQLDNLYIYNTDKEISVEGVANSSAVMHPAGTVILSRDAGVGKSAILAENMAVSQHFMAWKAGPKLVNTYLYYWLQYMKCEFEAIAMGSTIKTIGLPYFRKLRISLPPIDEQDRIATCLLQADHTINVAADELMGLKRLKAGLMSDLLTGSIRVPLEALS